MSYLKAKYDVYETAAMEPEQHLRNFCRMIEDQCQRQRPRTRGYMTWAKRDNQTEYHKASDAMLTFVKDKQQVFIYRGDTYATGIRDLIGKVKQSDRDLALKLYLMAAEQVEI